MIILLLSILFYTQPNIDIIDEKTNFDVYTTTRPWFNVVYWEDQVYMIDGKIIRRIPLFRGKTTKVDVRVKTERLYVESDINGAVIQHLNDNQTTNTVVLYAVYNFNNKFYLKYVFI